MGYKGFCVPQQHVFFVGAPRNEFLLFFLMKSTPKFPVDNEKDGTLTGSRTGEPTNFLLNFDRQSDRGPFLFHLSFSGNLMLRAMKMKQVC